MLLYDCCPTLPRKGRSSSHSALNSLQNPTTKKILAHFRSSTNRNSTQQDRRNSNRYAHKCRKKCRKFRTGEVAYYLQTDKSGKIQHFWKFLLRLTQNKKNYFTDILSLSNDLNIAEFYSVTIKKLTHNITNSRLSYLKLKYSDVS